MRSNAPTPLIFSITTIRSLEMKQFHLGYVSTPLASVEHHAVSESPTLGCYFQKFSVASPIDRDLACATLKN